MKKTFLQKVALIWAFLLIYEISFPTLSWALTGGPSQPEVQSFEPVGTTEMVDLSTGDFNYNIPLMDIEGYPLNISYHAGITMDQEASWVGLGWNISPGVINRNMRGLPDDFKGDLVDKQMHIEVDRTVGANTEIDPETFGAKTKKQVAQDKAQGKFIEPKSMTLGQMDSLKNLDSMSHGKSDMFSMTFSYGVTYNNYRGVGLEMSITPAINAGLANKLGGNGSLGLSFSSQDGFSLSPSIGLQYRISKNSKETGDQQVSGAIGVKASTAFNSRGGLKKLSVKGNASVEQEKKLKSDEKGKYYVNSVTNTVKTRSHSMGSDFGSSFSFGTATYSPQVTMPMSNSNTTLNGTFGLESKGYHYNGRVTGFVTEQELDVERYTKPAFGYLYSQNKWNDDVLLDFNREKDGAFSENTGNLPVTNFTYDFYSVTGQGIGAQYRLYRSDVGILHDDVLRNTSSSKSLGVEAGFAEDIHLGLDVSTNSSLTGSGKWVLGNRLVSSLDFVRQGSNPDPLYEPAYFKNVGEKTEVDMDFYNRFGRNAPVRVKLEANAANEHSATNTLVAERITSSGVEPVYIGLSPNKLSNVRKKRDKRNQVITYLTAFESASAALDKKIKNYTVDPENGEHSATEINRWSWLGKRKLHHLSEVTALNPDGMRYVYGIPAYNSSQVEQTFNVNINSTSNSSSAYCTNGLIYYDTLLDASVLNPNGQDKYFTQTSMGPYAHSYLLTAVLSPDYVDVTDNGVTFDDDLGTAVKINYHQADDKYHWRTPYQTGQAYHNPGHIGDKQDDKGSIVYGEKELWYVQSIESKNYVAEFRLSSREDGLGVKGIHGVKNLDDRMWKLDKIVLYSKSDRQINGEFAVPVKVVHFEYDYSLCPSVPNNSGKAVYANGIEILDNDSADNPLYNVNMGQGKLTLKKIYFTYGRSEKAALSPYSFYYANDNSDNDYKTPQASLNPDYNIKGYDRWGNYKPVPYMATCANSTNPTVPSEFPYVKQVKDSADVYSTAWSLSRIDLPSGGAIRIQLEADDYAYVQHKRAMQMFKLVGAGDVTYGINDIPVGTIDNKLYIPNSDQHYEYLFFELDEREESNIWEYFLNEKGKPIELLYFNVFIDLKKSGTNYEYVKGYAEIDYSLTGNRLPFGKLSNQAHTGYVRIKKVAIGDRENTKKKVNPITKTAWQYARLNAPELVHPGSNPNATGESAIRGLLTSLTEVTTLWKSFNRTLENKEYARTFIAHRSWVRLYNPVNVKFGGGSRVKRLELEDNWSEMAPGNNYTNATYGQEYTYTTTEYASGNKSKPEALRTVRTVSSGVAAYEPSIGNDENPWRMPVYTNIEHLMAPDDRNYTETPYGESFFPAPVVVYAKVEVENLQYENVKRHATGKVVHEFYTAKEFPTIVRQTGIDKQRDSRKKVFPVEVEDHLTVSQGYSIELNDMHGKMKAKSVYAENAEAPMSSVRYEYFTDSLSKSILRLKNEVSVYNKNTNRIETKLIGTEMDVMLDARRQWTNTSGGAVEINVDLINTGVTYVPAIKPWANHSSEYTTFKSVGITKVVNTFGIVKKVIATENGSVIANESVLFDGETGDVLLTRTTNEFKDNIFNFTYPAHFAYEGMGHAYKNAGAVFHKVDVDQDTIKLQGGLKPSDYFYPGDEVLVIPYYDNYTFPNLFDSSYKHLWYYVANDGHSYFMQRDGDRIATGSIILNKQCYVKIIRSGRRNLQTTPIAQTTSLINPVNADSLKFAASTQVLNASAAEFSDQWGMYCNPVSLTTCSLNKDSFPVQWGRILKEMAKEGYLRHNKFGSYWSLDSIESFEGSRLKYYIDSVCSDTGEYYFKPRLGNNWGVVSGTGDSLCSVTMFIDFKKGECTSGFLNLGCFFFMLKFNCEDSVYIDSISNFTYNNSSSYYFTYNFDVHYSNGQTYALYSTASYDCPVSYSHTECITYCDTLLNKKLNPYLKGLRGVWRKKKDHLYLTQRVYTPVKVNVRKDGYYETFSPFWNYNGSGKPWQKNETNWTWTTEVTKYSPQGFEIENKDALNRFSAALYGANNLPVAVGSNAKLKQLAFDGFEDFTYNLSGCNYEHWNFKNDIEASDAYTDATRRHTGKKSIHLPMGKSHQVARKVLDCSQITALSSDTFHLLQPCECIDRFSPDTGYKYVFSGWISEDVSALNSSFTGAKIVVELVKASSVTTLEFKASGRIIENWQRIDTTFYVPYGTLAINVKLVAPSGNAAWFDDLRIHPFDGSMKSYVYDPVSLKLTAELDENNFATFYEYDAEGALIRVKKETEKGIVTLKESRSHSSKIYQP